MVAITATTTCGKVKLISRTLANLKQLGILEVLRVHVHCFALTSLVSSRTYIIKHLVV